MPNEGNNNGGTPGQNGGQQEGGEELTFDSWVADQDDQVKGLIDEHVKGLKSALDSERAQHKELAKTLKTATQELEQGTKARDALEKLTSRLEASEARLAFAEAMAGKVTNVKLAYLAAQEVGAVDGTGAVNLATLKTHYPELFVTTKIPDGNAGNGSGGTAPGKKDMNAFIRAAAGKQ